MSGTARRRSAEVVLVEEEGVAGPGPGSLGAQQAHHRPGNRQRGGHQQQGAGTSQAPARGQAAVVDLTDLTDDTPDTNADDDDVMITMVKVAKRRAPLLAQSPSKRRALLAPPQPPPPPPPPPSPKGFKCDVCMEYMKDNMASTPCGHLFCYDCVLSWIQKSPTCPQCRTKVTKTKVIRVYPPS